MTPTDMSPAKAAHMRAFRQLPPDVKRDIGLNCFKPLRITGSGGLALGLDNTMSVSAKREAIAALKLTLGEYGLVLDRVGFSQAVGKALDDGFVIAGASNQHGERPRLFNEDGSVSAEVLAEAERQSARRR